MADTPEKPSGMPRLGLIAVVLAGVLVLAAGAFVGLALRDGPQGAAGTLLASAIGGPFQLVDHNGKPFSDADLKGKWHLLFFGYTHCPDTCPTTLNELSLALDRLGKARGAVEIVLISVDPERDTPPRLAEYAARYGANPISWSFLTGSEQALQATVVEGFKVGAGKERGPGAGADAGVWEIFHGENLVLVDRQMRIRGYFPATPEGLDKLLEAVGRVANGA